MLTQKLSEFYTELGVRTELALSDYIFFLSILSLTVHLLLLRAEASMASSLLNSIPLSSSSSLCAPHTSSPFRAFPESISHFHQNNRNNFSVKAETLDFSGSFFEGGFGSGDDPIIPGTGFTAVEEKEEPQCPPGLRQYETMVVLRPDMSEDERLALTQKYEEVKFLTFSLLSLTFCLLDG